MSDDTGSARERYEREVDRIKTIREIREFLFMPWRWFKIIARELFYVGGIGYILYFFVVLYGNIELSGPQLYKDCVAVAVVGRVVYSLAKTWSVHTEDEPPRKESGKDND